MFVASNVGLRDKVLIAANHKHYKVRVIISEIMKDMTFFQSQKCRILQPGTCFCKQAGNSTHTPMQP